MGHYTKFVLKAKLKQNTPDIILHVLRGLIERKYTEKTSLAPFFSHKFFILSNWYDITSQGCGRSPCKEGIKPYLSDTKELLIFGEFKSYDGEILEFCKWLLPYIDDPSKTILGSFELEHECHDDVPPFFLIRLYKDAVKDRIQFDRPGREIECSGPFGYDSTKVVGDKEFVIPEWHKEIYNVDLQ